MYVQLLLVDHEANDRLVWSDCTWFAPTTLALLLEYVFDDGVAEIVDKSESTEVVDVLSRFNGCDPNILWYLYLKALC